MTKKRLAASRAATKHEVSKAEDQPGGDKDTTTFSIRLTDEQRDRVMRAAQLKGWTPTSLIRTATLERAAHIINTSQITRPNLKALALMAARQLFEFRTYQRALTFDEITEVDQLQGGDDPPSIIIPVVPLPIEVLAQIKRAAYLGGSEFLNLIVEYSEVLQASDRDDLPDAVDPGTTGS